MTFLDFQNMKYIDTVQINERVFDFFLLLFPHPHKIFYNFMKCKITICNMQSNVKILNKTIFVSLLIPIHLNLADRMLLV
jgi:hypothetical protein